MDKGPGKNNSLPEWDDDRIHGTCLEMCPTKERNLREREGLLHKLECLQISEPQSYPLSSWPVEQSTNIGVDHNSKGRRHQHFNARGGNRRPLPKADITKTIKSFARSAAGLDKTSSEDLRPAYVLKKTVAHLCTEVLRTTEHPFNVVYDFIFDRLRSVRQDLVIQRIEDGEAILILETIVKFHIYSDFRLREEPITIYDPHINQKHLVDCLRKLLNLYEVNNYWGSSRAEFEALQCLIFLGAYDVISRAYSLKQDLRSRVLEMAIEMALSYQSKNYVRFFRRMAELPTTLQLYCVRHISTMRSLAFQVMCISYGVNSCKLPLESIVSQLNYRSTTTVHRDMSLIGTEVIKNEKDAKLKYAKFLKSNRSMIEAKTKTISSEINSSSLDALVKDKTCKLASKLICSW